MIDKINARLRATELLKDMPLRCSNCQYWTKRSTRRGDCNYWLNTVKKAMESENPILMIRTHRKDLCEKWELKEGLE